MKNFSVKCTKVELECLKAETDSPTDAEMDWIQTSRGNWTSGASL